MIAKQFTIRCQNCSYKFVYQKPVLQCPKCHGQWLNAEYDYPDAAKWQKALKNRPMDLWRYHELLPIQDGKNIVSLGKGWSPLIKAENLGLMLGHPNIYIKDERQGPTASFKDRQAAVAVSAMKEAGIKEAVVASTGNVAIAYSAHCARAGIKLWVFVTSSVPPEKMREVALYGSEVIKVAGTYDQAKQIAADFAKSKNLYLDRGIKTIAAKEAMKTLAYEISEQLGNVFADAPASLPNGDQNPWQSPDWFLQAVSGGMGPVGVMKGFQELNDMGIINSMPKLACFQVSGCAPMVHAFKKGQRQPMKVENPVTEIATLATGSPGHTYTVLYDLIQDHGGIIEAVTDTEAFNALQVVAQMDGLSVEPATAVTFAGLFKLIREGVIKPDETVVVNCSGHTFPVEKHIVGDQYTRDMQPNGESNRRGDGLLVALEDLDDRVQRIAIIEDNIDSARLIRRILQAQGDFLIEEAHDGRSGLDLIQRTRPNLVLLDLMMPGLDGFDIVEIMKATPELANIPVIVITAKELSAIERDRLNGKIKALLQKGTFMDSDLITDIRQALP